MLKMWIIIYRTFWVVVIANTCNAGGEKVSIYPQEGHKVYMQQGKGLELFCKANSGYSSRDLMFNIGERILESHIVNNSTRRLFISNPKTRQVYYCQNTASNSKDYVRVYVATAPLDVKDFKCESSNLESLKCFWNSFDNIRTNYSLAIKVEGFEDVCVASDREKTTERYCIWKTKDLHQVQKQEYVNFKLKATNHLGTNEQTFSLNQFSITKPYSPENLIVAEINSFNVNLLWNIPGKLTELIPRGIEHKIKYQVIKPEEQGLCRVDARDLPNNSETYQFRLSVPYPHMRYRAKVAIKPVQANEEFWSDFSDIEFKTTSEKPGRSPDTTAGAFTQNVFASRRFLYVYWKPLEDYEFNGDNFSYEVQLKDIYGTQILRTQNQGHLLLNQTSSGAINISIWSSNEKGLSGNSSSLYIPSVEQIRSMSLKSFTTVDHMNGTYELLWIGVDSVDNYTVFWCKYIKNNVCSDRIDFEVIDAKYNSHIVKVSEYGQYQFAISVNKGSVSSGMIWSRCMLSKAGLSMDEVPIDFNISELGERAVKLNWTLNCLIRDDFLFGYNITYYEKSGAVTGVDDNTAKNYKYVNGSPHTGTIVTGLQPFTTYEFRIALNTKLGVKMTHKKLTATTLEDVPSTPRNISVNEVKSNSLSFSIEPPEFPNGDLSHIKYVVYNFGDKLCESKFGATQMEVENLSGFTNYSLSVRACNIDLALCSNHSDILVVKTKTGRPSRPENLRVDRENLSWSIPSKTEGFIHHYEVNTIRDGVEESVFNTTDLSYHIQPCEGSEYNVTYFVRAVNDADSNYTEKKSSKTKINTEFVPLYGEWATLTVNCDVTTTYFLVAYVFIGLPGVLYVGYLLWKAYKKCEKMSDIDAELDLFLMKQYNNGSEANSDNIIESQHSSGSPVKVQSKNVVSKVHRTLLND